MDSLYRDVLTRDRPHRDSSAASHLHTQTDASDQSHDSQSCSSQSEEASERQAENSQTESEPDSSELQAPQPEPPPRQLDISQPIGSLRGAATALTVRGDIETISEEEILKNREGEEGIRSIPRFQNYQPGKPSKVSTLKLMKLVQLDCYYSQIVRPALRCLDSGLDCHVSLQVLCVKNLSRQASAAQLVALFSRFEPEGGPAVLYRLLTGRMKGQAFITLPGEEAAGLRTQTPPHPAAPSLSGLFSLCGRC